MEKEKIHPKNDIILDEKSKESFIEKLGRETD